MEAWLKGAIELRQRNGGALSVIRPINRATWAMILIGFVGLGFALRQSRRKALFA
jgi:regulation of enolase protein 1 (concanavalin A-like superfamily)